jgi:hypothetical protein
MNVGVYVYVPTYAGAYWSHCMCIYAVWFVIESRMFCISYFLVHVCARMY